jgi:hypothetical protein
MNRLTFILCIGTENNNDENRRNREYRTGLPEPPGLSGAETGHDLVL